MDMNALTLALDPNDVILLYTAPLTVALSDEFDIFYFGS